MRDYRTRDSDVIPGVAGVCVGIDQFGNPIEVCGPPGIDEAAKRNRDGYGIRTGLAHLVPMFEPVEKLRLLAALERYEAEGAEYEYDGIEAGMLAEFAIDYGLTAEFESTYYARWYDHPSTYPDSITPFVEYQLSPQKKAEHLLVLTGRVERELLYDLALSVRYRFEQRFSNTQVFDYSRHHGGVYLTWRPKLD